MATQQENDCASLETLNRARRRLLRNKPVLNWLFEEIGVGMNIVERFHLGLSEKIKSDGGADLVLSFPVMGADGKPKKRRMYRTITEIISNEEKGEIWCAGAALVYFSGSIRNKKRVLICDNIFDVWRLSHLIGNRTGAKDLLITSSSRPNSIPREFQSRSFFAQFEEIYFGHDGDETGRLAAASFRNYCFADVKQILLPKNKEDWRSILSKNNGFSSFIRLLDQSPFISSGEDPIRESDENGELGEFAIETVNCNGAYVNSRMYYPYMVERRELQQTSHKEGSTEKVVVYSYQTKVVRSDGEVLDIRYLPAPKGTPTNARVLVLSDGTRIDQVPSPNHYATWHVESINEYIRAKRARSETIHRSFDLLLSDLIDHFRRSVWLLFEDDYAILALYSAMSYVYNIFEAIPLLLVYGPKGSGKSELGAAIEQVSFNSKIIGQSSAASTVRILNESRGLIVFDDLESIKLQGEKNGFNEIHQMLKLSYKKKTSKKFITDKSGKTVLLDFFGPKVINNTRGADSILASRMITIQTHKFPFDLKHGRDLTGSSLEFCFNLRNELHSWAMNNCSVIDRHYRSLFPSTGIDRTEEIFLPLKSLALLSAKTDVIEKINRASEQFGLEILVPIGTNDLILEALKSCIAGGYVTEVALPHIQLQIAFLIENKAEYRRGTVSREWKHAQTVGNLLQEYRFRDPQVKVRRARLYGKETRIYKLDKKFVESVLKEISESETATLQKNTKSAFDFCENRNCSDCLYNVCCEEAVPGLRSSKLHRLRRQEGVR